MKARFLVSVCMGVLGSFSTIGAAPLTIPLEVGKGERLLVVEPHPDDGILGAGGMAQRVLARGGSVFIVLLTAGDGFVAGVTRETGLQRPPPSAYVAYGRRRLGEAKAAWRRLGGDRPKLEFLGFPDGGLLDLLRSHWFHVDPECSQTTGGCDPPYDAEAKEPDVPYTGVDLCRELVEVFRKTQPTLLAFPDPLDQHVDHRAAGLFTLLAIDEWMRREPDGRKAMPRLLAYLVHWSRWPPEIQVSEAGIRNLGAGSQDVDFREHVLFLPEPGPFDLPQDLPDRGLVRASLFLTDAEVAAKRAALSQYGSQMKWMSVFLEAFARRTEPFTVLTENEVRGAAR